MRMTRGVEARLRIGKYEDGCISEIDERGEGTSVGKNAVVRSPLYSDSNFSTGG